ncbi:MAG: hypothetical protein JRI68_16920 [Deltaproteobacteria bacterium]|nr:hypothetical protein [Deltaproteobacteria bacterium]
MKGFDTAAVRGADAPTIAGWCDELTSSDAQTRAKAAFLLAMLPTHPSDLSKRLRRLSKKEKDEHAKASALLALGASEGRRQSVQDVKLFDRLSGCDTEASRLPPLGVRLAAIVALAWVKPFDVSQEMIGLLRANRSMTVDAKAMPWNAGDLGGLIQRVLPSLEDLDADEALAELEALMQAHPWTRKEGWPMAVEWPWSRTVHRIFASLGDWREDAPILSELSDGQRRALELALQRKLNTRTLRRQGFDLIMPTWDWSKPTWHRYLGLTDPGPLDAELELDQEGETRRYPIWKWFRLLARDKVDAGLLQSGLAAALSPAEIVALGRDATTMAYATYDEGDDDPSPRSCLLRDLIDQLGAKAKAADAQAIRFALDRIGGMEMWKMQSKGWKGGPFKPKAKKKKAKKKKAKAPPKKKVTKKTKAPVKKKVTKKTKAPAKKKVTKKAKAPAKKKVTKKRKASAKGAQARRRALELPTAIPDFEVASDERLPGGLTTRSYRHVPTSILFRLIPGGTLRRGFSDEEEEALRDVLSDAGDGDAEAGLAFLDSLDELRPVAEVTLPPFLLAPEPLTQSQLMAMLGDSAPAELGDLEDCLSLSVAEQIVAILNDRGLRLPSEAEWEHSYRAGTSGPFPWGVDRPSSPWAPANAFGLEGMGALAELCADGWQPNHAGARRVSSVRSPNKRPRVARGGAAEVFPWQDVAEWMTMLAAFRSSSREHDGFLRIRPACSLP